MDELSEDEMCKVAFVMAIKDSLNVVGGKWKLPIICTLLRSPRRFNEIERLIAGLSPRMLAKELRELELNGVVTRYQNEGPSPPAAVFHYRLTPSGKKLEALIIGMATWGVEHRDSILKNAS